jgi:ArsR family metal-binding transcriptional regulator
MEDLLVKGYDLTLETHSEEEGEAQWNATASLVDDITEVLPYLNARWSGAVYNIEAQSLTWRRDQQTVSLRPRHIGVSNLPDRNAAGLAIEDLVAEINHVWADRANLEPSYVRRERLVSMDVYRLLPQTNCRVCGAPTCFVFANQVAAGMAQVTQCTPLFEEEQYAEKRIKMLALVEASA